MGNEGDTYVIKGIKAGVTDTTVPLRLEADSWYPGKTLEHLIQNSLFIWALKIFQERDPTGKLSFFQIAGIHGYPYQPWDEEDYTAATGGMGYCTHDSLLFPCWHRPYAYASLREVISQVPESKREQWKSAAGTWRFPYWDWAQKKTRPDKADPQKDTLVYDIPLIAKKSQIQVIDYKKADIAYVVTIDNPMYRFNMPGKAQMGSFGINDVRHINAENRLFTVPKTDVSSSSPSAAAHPAGRDSNPRRDQSPHPWYNHNADGVPLAEMVYRLYEPDYMTSFAQFATTRVPKGEKRDPKAYLNLEFLHNNIHNWTGGFGTFMGHMTEVPVAGFDPIFFMHHCNIDRQFAIWQALNENNPNNWFDHLEEPYDDDGTWNISPQTIVTLQTPLAPFHKNRQGDCFVSDDIRNWMSLGYSYPELQPWLDKYKTAGQFDEAKYMEDIRNQLKTLYQTSMSPSVSGWFDDSLKSDIIVNVQYDRFAFDGLPYTIYFFLGEKDTFDTFSGPPHKQPQHVGFVYTFSNPAFGVRAGGGGCKKCLVKSREGTLSRAQIPLTATLVARSRTKTWANAEAGEGPLEGIHALANLEKHEVGKYLEKFLHWRVKSASGADIEIPDEEPFVEVTVHYRGARFDDHESDAEYVPLERATQAKQGGYMYKGSSAGATESLSLPMR
ncbi:Di-copper centre-containing protein [Canariomyces notabilis]|uniref:tyrosinase n=1 Tax=Canariomyces notabilis TaxID=2074819 RepID=A0AAN6TNB8_9PEZI|nr:Di-copper centre-containing protein [Canariomyces arenarius]